MESLHRPELLDSDPPLPPDGQGLCYRDTKHFEEFAGRAARRAARERASAWANVAWHPVGAAALYVAGIAIIASCFAVLGVVIGVPLTWAVVLSVMLVYHPAVSLIRSRSLKKRIQMVFDDRLCFACGYSLVGNEPDDAGWSACPECGRVFHANEYMRPDVGSKREWDHAWLEHLEPAARDELRDRLGIDQFP